MVCLCAEHVTFQISSHGINFFDLMYRGCKNTMMSKDDDKCSELNPIAQVILQGLYDENSPLHLLVGHHYILKAIWQDIITYYKSRIKFGNDYDIYCVKVKWGHSYTALDSRSDWLVHFPQPSDININMMPFVMARSFKESQLERHLQEYWDEIISQCITHKELGKIGYLTIHESYVEKGNSQRRPGIHTESPGLLLLQGGKGRLHTTSKFFGWGHGLVTTRQELQGGIYMVSNVPNSCKVWNCKILPPEDNCSPDAVGEHGNIEHLRSFINAKSEMMQANTMYWITDRTPHEALPLVKQTYRQYVRVVTSQVSYWYEDHSTKNPLGVLPDPKITTIVKGSKFDGTCYIAD